MEAISQIVALAVLMPIVGLDGRECRDTGADGAVRALATKDLTRANLMRVVTREAAVGLINGAAFALVMGGGGRRLVRLAHAGGGDCGRHGGEPAGRGAAGILIPVALDRLGIDPALLGRFRDDGDRFVVGFFRVPGPGGWWCCF